MTSVYYMNYEGKFVAVVVKEIIVMAVLGHICRHFYSLCWTKTNWCLNIPTSHTGTH